MTRPVRYRCPDHGGFAAHVQCGYGSGRAPESTLCPICQAPAVRDTSSTGGKRPQQRCVIVLEAPVAERLHAYCEDQGITIDAALDALVPDGRAKP